MKFRLLLAFFLVPFTMFGANSTLRSLTAATQAYTSDITIVRQGTDTSDKSVTLAQVSTALAAETKSLTNKTINDITNYVDANATHTRVYNGTGSTITKGQALYVVGWNAGNSAINVGLARANSSSTMPCIGLAEASIAAGAVGEMRTAGTLTGLNTNAFSTADKVYVSTSTAGDLQNTEPTTNAQLIGIVGNQSATVGTIEIARDPESESYTGEGSYVRSNSPTLVTPTLGTIQGGTLLNGIGSPAKNSTTMNAGPDSQGSANLSSSNEYVNIDTPNGNPSAITLAVIGWASRTVILKNSLAVPLKVYPGASNYIDALAINVPVTILPGYMATFISEAYGTKWRSSYIIATSDGAVNFTDVTTGNVSTTAHGYTPKAPNDAAQVLLGTGAWGTVPTAITSGFAAYNHFDNSDFQVSQVHGSTVNFDVTGATGTEAHLIDRWRVKLYNANGINFQRVGSATRPLTGSSSAYQLRFATGSTTNDVKDFSLVQRFTASQVAKMQDSMTLKFNLRCAYVNGSNVQWSAIYSTPASFNDFTGAINAQRTTTLTSTAIADSTWTAYTDSFTGLRAFSNIANGLQVEIRIKTLSNSSNYEACIADVQFNSGATAAAFVNPTLSESEARCFPFYQKTMDRNIAAIPNCGTSNGTLTAVAGSDGNRYAIRVGWRFVVSMFKTPTITTYCPGRDDADWQGASGQPTGASTYSSTAGCIIYASGGTSTANTAYSIHASADARL